VKKKNDHEKDSSEKKAEGKDESKSSEHKPQFPILKNFEEKRGVYDLINVALAIVKTFKS